MERNIIKDSVFGFAIGDAMGVPIEFMQRELLLKKPLTKMIGYGTYDVPKGCWSDDTPMLIATIDSIVRSKGINYNDMADCFCDWINDDKYTPTNKMFDIGITTKNALINYWHKKTPNVDIFAIGRNDLSRMEKELDATKCGDISFESNGNGSLMRILPLIHYFYFYPTPEDEKFEIIKNTSSITHAHEISIIGCLIYVNYVLDILNGKDKVSSYENLGSYNYNKYFSADTINIYSRILTKQIPTLKINQINSDGYILHTLESVLWVTLKADNFRDSIVGAINLGDDTDTIGALVGGISGILYGLDNIPVDWINNLKAKSLLDDLCNKYIYYLSGE